MHITLVVVSTVLGAYSPIQYIIDVLKGACKPHRVTRFALCVSLTLTFFSTKAAHGSLIALIIAAEYAVCAAIAFGLSLSKRFGVGGTSKADMLCLVIALAGTAGWAKSGDPRVGVVCAIIADGAAYVPTIINTWINPDGEAHWTYTLSALANGLGVMIYPFTIGSWPILYLGLMALVMVVCIKRPAIKERWRQLRLKLQLKRV